MIWRKEALNEENICVRVTLDISKPIARKKKLTIDKLDSFWVRFTYEKLHDFCFKCGIVGHGLKDCSAWKGSTKQRPESELPYGNWLRTILRGTQIFSMDSISFLSQPPSRTIIDRGNSDGKDTERTVST